ncbi:MAG: Co2+/Mg2+ efflux protein ApaG [Gammaproteobacteria bacterium]|nr:MAG: Co2+/Mg2+ efflux protein ApaG [Gammaproteobacteria bacterium]
MNDKNNSIHVDVETTYLAQESQPEKSRYLFSYTITIKNQGDNPARLLSRYWKITGGDGHEQEVEGDGVIGLHPHLAPEQSFTYTSAAMLDTPVGMMQGHYLMLGDDGERFDVDIPAFTLAAPQSLH